MQVGDRVQLRTTVNSVIQGSIGRILSLSEENDSFLIEELLPRTFRQIVIGGAHNLESANFLSLDDLLDMRYILASRTSTIDGSTYYLLQNNLNHRIYTDQLNGKPQLIEKKAKKVAYPIIDYKILKDVFKYIPVSDSNYHLGFYDPKTKNLTLKYRNKSRDKKDKIVVHKKNEEEIPSMVNFLSLTHFCKFRIKNYLRSAELFKFTNQKKEAVGKLVEIDRFELQVEVKNSNKLENTVFVQLENGNYRFVLEDIEILYPNVNGWSPKKNRTIEIGKPIKVINDKHSKHFKKNDKLVIADIKKIGNKVYLGYEVNNKIVFENRNKFKVI